MKSKPEKWEKEFRLEMASLLGREGNFAMNSIVRLVKKYLVQVRSEVYHEGFVAGREL